MIIDIATNTFMESIQLPCLTILSKVISIIFDPVAFFVLSLIIALLLFKRNKKKSLFLASIIILTSGLIIILKELIQRARPLNGILLETSHSFPSGHTTMAFVFFGIIAFLFSGKKHKKTIYVIASLLILLTGLSRIYLRIHWLTDVVAGFVLGGLILILGIFIYKKL
jgi:undecaprenyl-diphosphatase